MNIPATFQSLHFSPLPQAANHMQPAAVGGVAANDGCSASGTLTNGAEPQNERPQYNVYNSRIDPRNNMPFAANQLPWPGQRKELSIARAVSTIPKAGTDGTWVFPSPQMFYNALMRKGKGDDVTEDDMDSVISVHNGALRML